MPKPKSERTKISRSPKSKTAVRKSETQSKVRSSITAGHVESKQARLITMLRASSGATVASNRRLVALDDNGVTFKWKDYRIEGPERYKLMTLDTHEFIRRFLMHVLPQGFHRIRYCGWLTS